MQRDRLQLERLLLKHARLIFTYRMSARMSVHLYTHRRFAVVVEPLSITDCQLRDCYRWSPIITAATATTVLCCRAPSSTSSSSSGGGGCGVLLPAFDAVLAL